MTYHDADSAPAEDQGKPDESDGTADIEEAMRQCERLLLQVDAGLRRIGVTEALGAGVSAVVALAAVLSAVDSGGSPGGLDRCSLRRRGCHLRGSAIRGPTALAGS